MAWLNPSVHCRPRPRPCRRCAATRCAWRHQRLPCSAAQVAGMGPDIGHSDHHQWPARSHHSTTAGCGGHHRRKRCSTGLRPRRLWPTLSYHISGFFFLVIGSSNIFQNHLIWPEHFANLGLKLRVFIARAKKGIQLCLQFASLTTLLANMQLLSTSEIHWP